MSVRSAVISQFKHPRGLLGRLAGFILANRGSNLRRNRWTVELLALKNGERVLEVGCGPGVTLELCLAHKGVTATGVDHSALMVAQAGRRNRRAAREGRLTLIEGTVDDVPSHLAPFDKVFSINVIQFVDKRAFVGRIKTMLKPGGVLATTYQPRGRNPARTDMLKMGEDLRAILAAEGFTNIRLEELALKPVPAICVHAQRDA